MRQATLRTDMSMASCRDQSRRADGGTLILRNLHWSQARFALGPSALVRRRGAAVDAAGLGPASMAGTVTYLS